MSWWHGVHDFLDAALVVICVGGFLVLLLMLFVCFMAWLDNGCRW